MIRINTTQVQLKLNGGSDKTNTNVIFTQNDNLVGIIDFTIIDDMGVEIDYSTVTKATMQIMIGSNTYLEPILCVINDSSISANVVNNMLSYTGIATCSLKLEGSTDQLYTTTQFTYVVQSSLYGDDSTITEAQTSAVNSLISYLTNKTYISIYDTTLEYEYDEYVLKDNIIYKSNSEIPTNTSFVSGGSSYQWSKVLDLNTAGETVITKASVENVLTGEITTHTHPNSGTTTVVNDTLISTSTTEALSANQGTVLKALIDGIGQVTVNDTLTSTSVVEALSANQGRTLKALVDALTDNGTVTARIVLTQAEYDALSVKVATTEYVIVG